MHSNAVSQRRHFLKIMGGAPLLPLAGTLGASSAALLAACGGGGDATPLTPTATYKSVSFSSMPAPSAAADMATTSVGSTMTVTFSDSSHVAFNLAYQPFFITGDMVSDGSGGTVLAGGYYDINNQPIVDKTVAGKERQFFSDCPDGTTLINVANPTVTGIKGKAVFAVVQFEYTSLAQDGTTGMYGKLPSPIAVLTLDQDQTTGKLTLVKYANVDTSGVNGLWITCGASLSPWGTHLSSEEYEPDAFATNKSQLQAFSTNLYGSATLAKPYNYGHMPEVVVNPDGTGTITKHYCMGRISHELVQVMPDNRTVLMGDDATNAGYFVFVADKEKDLSSGTLYVAQLTSSLTSVDPATAATGIRWIKLGSATSNDIRALAASLNPTDIMAVSATDPALATPADTTYTKIWANGKTEWVKLVAGMEKAAAFLETHRYAALMGASMGFSKMEGTTVNATDKVAYSALSYCRDSMVAGNGKNNAAANVNLPTALQAGATMALNLKGGQLDTASNAINSEWMPVDITALVVGEDLVAADPTGNTANPDKVANPDNLKFSEKMRTLFIGEDSGMHVNNYLWAYNVDTKVLSRVMSVPAGAESTGLHAADEVNGWTYIMSNFQHAGDYTSATTASVKTAVDSLINANYKDKFGAAVGYLTATATSVKLSK